MWDIFRNSWRKSQLLVNINHKISLHFQVSELLLIYYLSAFRSIILFEKDNLIFLSPINRLAWVAFGNMKYICGTLTLPYLTLQPKEKCLGLLNPNCFHLWLWNHGNNPNRIITTESCTKNHWENNDGSFLQGRNPKNPVTW